MKTRFQLGMLKLTDPRVLRVVLFGLMLALAALAHGSVAYANNCPGGSGGGCSGG